MFFNLSLLLGSNSVYMLFFETLILISWKWPLQKKLQCTKKNSSIMSTKLVNHRLSHHLRN